MIPEGPLVCDDALGAPPTSPFELYKPGDRPGYKPGVQTRGQTERFPVLRGGCKPGIQARDKNPGQDKPGDKPGGTNPGTDGTFSGFARSTSRQEARRQFPRHLLFLRPAP